MNKQQFYETFARYVQAEGYAPRINSETMLKSANVPAWATIAVGALFGAQSAMYLNSAHIGEGASKTAELESEFIPMINHTPVVLFRFFLGSALVMSAVESDDLSDAEILDVVKVFDGCLVRATKYVAQRGMSFWKHQAGTVSGSLVFVFWDSAKATHFTSTLQKQCSTQHFKKMTYLYPFAVDVSARRVFTQPAFKFMQLSSDEKMTKKLFGSSSA